MVESRQLSALDADALARLDGNAPESEEEILRWLAGEYGLEYTGLDNVEPDRDILARFPARICCVRKCCPCVRPMVTSKLRSVRLFAAPGLDSLKSFTDLKLRPVLAPSTALQREIKKHLGVGADTLNLLEQEEGFPGRRRRPAGRRRSRQSRRGREHHPLRQPDPGRRAFAAHVGHPRRSRSSTSCASATASMVCCRRCRVPATDQAVPTRDCLAHQDSQQPEHRREARAAGRAHQASASRATTWTSVYRSSRCCTVRRW